MNRFSKLKITLYLSAIFLAGLVTGIVLTCLVAKHFMPNQERMTRRWCRELESRLGLTQEQLQRIEPVVRETIGQFKTTLANDALSSLSNCNARISVELTPEQKLKFEQMEKEQRDFIMGKFGTKPEGMSH